MSTTIQQPMRVSGGTQGAAPTDVTPVPVVAKKKRTRSSPLARPAYIVVQVLDESGQPSAFDKKRLKILAVERTAEKVLEMTEAGDHPNAFYLRVIVPATNRSVPAAKG